MKNFFDIVEQKIFNPLVGKNNKVNYAILVYINERMKDDLESYEKKEVVNWIKEYFDSHPTLSRIDDENENETMSDTKEFASRKLNYLSNCGWLTSETIGFTQYYSMNSSAILIINAMQEVVKNETKPIEYTSYVYSIYNGLKNFELSQSTNIIEMLYKLAGEFYNNLRSVNNIIRKYITNLLKTSDKSAKTILQTLLIEYQDNVVSKVFNNLRTGDNPSKYRNYIIETIDKLLENNLEQIVDNYRLAKTVNKSEAKEFIETSLNYIKNIFDNINDSIELLNSRNEKYVQSANSRVQFLLNNDKNVEGRIYEILKLIGENSDYTGGFNFNIKDIGKIDETSLYKYTRNKKKVSTKLDFAKPTIDEEFTKRELQRIQSNIKYNLKNVNDWVLQKLDNKNSIEAKDIPLLTYEDITLLFLSILYSTNKLVDYSLDFNKNSEYIHYNNSKLENFTIRRKNNDQ